MPKTAEQLAKESENKSYSNLGKTLLILPVKNMKISFLYLSLEMKKVPAAVLQQAEAFSILTLMVELNLVLSLHIQILMSETLLYAKL